MHQGATEALKWLERRGSKRVVAGMARYGIPSDGAFGVPMGRLLEHAKRLGKDHALALALWETGRYEAKLLTALVDDPRQVTRRQMDAWAAGLALNAKALAAAKRLAQSGEAGCRWVGKEALRELASPKVRVRLARRAG